MSVAWVKETLDSAGVSYRERHHPQAFTAQELAQREHVSGHAVAKVVVAKADQRILLLILPATRKVELNEVREIAGARHIRLASEQEMRDQLGDCEVGAVPPLRHWRNAEVWMDSTLRTDGNILFQGGNHVDAVEVPYFDWFALVKPRVEAFSTPADEESSVLQERDLLRRK